jgi:hypothetical protein
MKEAGHIGPFYVHYDAGEFNQAAQRRPEDPVYLRQDSIEWLSRLGFELASGPPESSLPEIDSAEVLSKDRAESKR